MDLINIVNNIILATKSGIIFSILIFIICFLGYKIKVKNYTFTLHLKILEHIKDIIDKKSHENRMLDSKERYRSLIKNPSFLGIIIPLLIVGIIAYILYSQLVFFAVVGSGSMEPAFKKSDLILMQNIDVNVENGDIIMFDTNSVLLPVTHRVIDVTGSGFYTKGDARRSKDDWVVKYEQINGKAVTFNGKPIIIKEVGSYFIEDIPEGIVTPMHSANFIFMRKVIQAIKSLGLIIFFFAIFIYILNSIK